jgi:hypothetical protein
VPILGGFHCKGIFSHFEGFGKGNLGREKRLQSRPFPLPAFQTRTLVKPFALAPVPAGTKLIEGVQYLAEALLIKFSPANL